MPSTASMNERNNFAQMAGAKMLEVHGDLLIIDSLVKQYPSYSHDDIFNMEVGFVMALILKAKQEAYITENTQEMLRKAHKK